MHAKIKNYIGKKVIFGVRPEDLYNKKYISKTDPDRTIKAKVDVIKPLGAEIFIYLASGKHSLVGKMDLRTQVKVEENIKIVIDMEKTHIFGPGTLLIIV
jgi:multiple sugar transport system ATP-binding protein